MESGGPVMNGDISRSPVQTGPLEDTLQQMNILIQENRDLKEALRQTNVSMKERFEGLSAWKEKQKEERDFLEAKLTEAKVRIDTLTNETQGLTKKLATKGGAGQCSEVEALRAQVARLQAEKNDLVALNSELQLKTDQNTSDDSFIEIIKVTDGGADVSDHCKGLRGAPGTLSMTTSRLDSEEVTVSQLLQSLRNETQRADRLQEELLQTTIRLKQLERRQSETEQSTQTSEETKQDASKAASEVENLKSQVMTLYKDLQQAQSKLDEAEGMKKNLQDRCREVEHDVVTLKAQLVEKQTVKSENDLLKLQLDSMQAQSLVELRKVGEERNNFGQLKEAYSTLFKEYSEMKEESKKKESQMVQKELLEDLQNRLNTAEKTLKLKQAQIEEMKQEVFQKQTVQSENDRLKVQLDSMQAQSLVELRKVGEERSNFAQLKEAYTKLFEDYTELKEERKKRESKLVQREVVEDLQERLDSAEKALAEKQERIDEMKKEIFEKEKELETVNLFKVQAEVYSSDFHAERAAREKIHEEKERLLAQLEYVKIQNSQLQDEMDSLGRMSLTEMQKRHGGGNQPSLVGRGADWQQQANIPEHACPKCNEILPDLDSLQIHIMDCIN